MKYNLIMSSKLYGTERFPYDSKEEAEKGKRRIQARIKKLNDGVKRHFKIKPAVKGEITKVERR